MSKARTELVCVVSQLPVAIVFTLSARLSFSKVEKNTAGAGLTYPNIENLNIHVFWNFNVLEMTLKTFHFARGLPRTPLFFSSMFQTDIFP